MSLSDLFPGDEFYAVRVWGADSTHQMMRCCARCGALVSGRNCDKHYRWHQAVDTGATTLLSTDSAPRSSGAGRPNPKEL